MAAAFIPATPAPITTTLAAYTPETPPISVPRPPPWRIRWYAPTCGARRPATSLIGASNGSSPLGSWTVSYAMAVTPRSIRARVQSRLAARCR